MFQGFLKQDLHNHIAHSYLALKNQINVFLFLILYGGRQSFTSCLINIGKLLIELQVKATLKSFLRFVICHFVIVSIDLISQYSGFRIITLLQQYVLLQFIVRVTLYYYSLQCVLHYIITVYSAYYTTLLQLIVHDYNLKYIYCKLLQYLNTQPFTEKNKIKESL